MKSKSVGYNAILNMIRQSLSILFPLIAYPYAVRVLGPESLGKVNFVQSIIDYFSLFAMLGVANYVIREGARFRDNSQKFVNFLNEVYTINVIFTILSYILLLFLTFYVSKLNDYKMLILIQSISLGLTTYGIDWINTIYEDFLKITIRSIFTYIVTIIFLFTFVKSEDDYYTYALLTVITNGIICVSNRFSYGKHLSLRLIKKTNFKKHIFPLLILFINSLAITVNTNFDTTMIGWFKGDYDVGIYSLPVKIYSVFKNIIFAIYIVALPRLSYYAGNQEKKLYIILNSKIWQYLILISFPVIIGLIVSAEYIIHIVGGSTMMKSVDVLRFLGFALIFSIFSGVIMNAMNISLKREKENMFVTFICAVINILLNFLFIPKFSYNGAAFTTLISEIVLLLLCVVRFPHLNSYVDFLKLKKSLFSAILGAVAIVVIANILYIIGLSRTLSFTFLIFSSIFVYMILLFVLKEEAFLQLLKLFKAVFRKINRQL